MISALFISQSGQPPLFLQIVSSLSSLVSLTKNQIESPAWGSPGARSMSQPCRFFGAGKCIRGDDCHFSHDISNSVLIAQAFSSPIKGGTPARRSPAPSTPAAIESIPIPYCPKDELVSSSSIHISSQLGLI